MAESIAIPKGTRDFLPEQVLKRNYIFNTLQSIFIRYGFVPIETPAMEQLSTLMGKYGEEGDKLLFKILNSGDFLSDVSEQDILNKNLPSLAAKICEKGLRYDLTVPFARFVVMHRNEITFPFKRFQIQPVWRADRPQKGRYREFYQCDVDIIGSPSLMNEVELLLIINEAFEQLNLKVKVLLNNRKILLGIADRLQMTERFFEFSAILDKLDKVGVEKVFEELRILGISENNLNALHLFLNQSDQALSAIDKLNLAEQFIQSEIGQKGIQEMRFLLEKASVLDLKTEIHFDFLLARGLNYYTGTILEVKSTEVPMGSICGGGRYDNLTGIFGMPDVSGVGMSFGADRIYDVLENLQRFPKNLLQTVKLFVTNFIPEIENELLQLCLELRKKQIALELFPDSSVKLKKQLTIASQKKIPFALIVGDNEIKQKLYTLKNMLNGEQKTLDFNELISLFTNDEQ
ncbi:MAG: histidine--tRNA ligase [Bacteroidales bacterium]|nr:histidine--tRNA ligase [Bacteroidales bacterium]